MKRMLVATAAVLLAGAGALVAFKAWRYRQESQRWFGEWESLHRDPSQRGRYAADNARLRAAGRVPHRVVFLGASITESLHLQELFPGQAFVNRGAGGQLVWQQLLRLEPDALALEPEAVVIKMCAINLLPDAPPYEDTVRYYGLMAETIRRRGVKAILATTVPVTRAWEAQNGGDITPKITRFNEWVRAQVREHHDVLLDYAANLADDQGYLPDALSDDGLHPNRAGLARMTATIRTALVENRGQPPVEPGATAAATEPAPGATEAAR